MNTARPDRDALRDELLRAGRHAVQLAHGNNLLADLLTQFVYPAVDRLTETVERMRAPAGPLSPEDVGRLMLTPSVNDLLGTLDQVIADVHDGWATSQLLFAWQPGSQGPASLARLRRNAPADAWQEETVDRSIANARARLKVINQRVFGYATNLQTRAGAYQDRSIWPGVIGTELQEALTELAQHLRGLAKVIREYAIARVVSVD